MEEVINNKIQKLAKEATELSNIKMSIQKQLKDIDTRLTQISGAIVEMKNLLKEQDTNAKDQNP